MLSGVISRGAGFGGGAGVGEAVAFGGAGAAGGGAAAFGLGIAGGAAGRGRGCATGSACFCVIALNTSPGFEMCDKSNLVLISSPSRGTRLAGAAGLPSASVLARKYCRIFSTSSGSTLLEWLFLSAMPILGSASMTCLEGISSSRASSLILIQRSTLLHVVHG